MRTKRTILYVGTYERDYPRNQQVMRLLRECDCHVVELHRPVWEIMRDKSQGVGGISGGIRVGFALVRAYAALLYSLVAQLRRADAVTIGYIGQLDMLVLGPLVRLSRKPLIFNPLVTLTDTLIDDRALVRSRSILGRLIWLVDVAALRLATTVIVDTVQNGEYVQRQFGVPQTRIIQVHVGADEEVFGDHGESRANSADSEAMRVLFYGKMIPLHGVETILEAVRILADEPGVEFEIIGSGQLEDSVHQFLNGRHVGSVTHEAWVDYRELPNRITVADCVLGIFGRSEKAARVVPNKVFQAMAMGSAIITRDSPAIRRVLKDGESGLIVPPVQPAALADAIKRLRDSELRDRLGRGARKRFVSHASDEVLQQKMGELLDQVFSDRRTSQTRKPG
jgi:glycosyltransferase involved in cell wall biosynthesis